MTRNQLLSCLHGDWLYLAFRRIKDADLQRVQQLEGIKWVDIRACTSITDAGMAHLAQITSITHLLLNGTQVGDAGVEHLAGLPNLRAIELAGTPVTDAVLTHLIRLPKLRLINLWGTSVSEAAVKRFRRRVARLERKVEVYWGIPTITIVTLSAKDGRGVKSELPARPRRKSKKQRSRLKSSS
jgi:hypothetical protein